MKNIRYEFNENIKHEYKHFNSNKISDVNCHVFSEIFIEYFIDVYYALASYTIMEIVCSMYLNFTIHRSFFPFIVTFYFKFSSQTPTKNEVRSAIHSSIIQVSKLTINILMTSSVLTF